MPIDSGLTRYNIVQQAPVPMFSVVKDPTIGSNITPTSVMNFSSIILNNESSWDAANNRFTAPAKGTYLFTLGVVEHTATLSIAWRKGILGQTNAVTMANGAYPAGTYSSCILALNQYDFIEIWVTSGIANGGSFTCVRLS
jgi:hypothetical protein